MAHSKVYIYGDIYKVISNFKGLKESHNSFLNEKKAYDFCNEENITHFSKHKEQLPKGIYIDEKKSRFVFQVRTDEKTVKYIKSSKDLDDLLEIRKYLIKNILSLF